MGKPTAEEVASTVEDEYDYECTVKSNSEFVVHNLPASDARDLAKFISVRGFELFVPELEERTKVEDLTAKRSD